MAAAFRKEVSREVKWRERRRGARVNSNVNIAIEWEGKSELPERLEARTRMVGPYGCLVVLPHEFELDQHVHVTNLANKQGAAAAIVCMGKKRVEGWEFGIELISPELDFWGLEL